MHARLLAVPEASDYDCSGGIGDGPKYTGYHRVTGFDPYGLDDDNTVPVANRSIGHRCTG